MNHSDSRLLYCGIFLEWFHQCYSSRYSRTFSNKASLAICLCFKTWPGSNLRLIRWTPKAYYAETQFVHYFTVKLSLCFSIDFACDPMSSKPEVLVLVRVLLCSSSRFCYTIVWEVFIKLGYLALIFSYEMDGDSRRTLGVKKLFLYRLASKFTVWAFWVLSRKKHDIR